MEDPFKWNFHCFCDNLIFLWVVLNSENWQIYNIIYANTFAHCIIVLVIYRNALNSEVLTIGIFVTEKSTTTAGLLIYSKERQMIIKKKY